MSETTNLGITAMTENQNQKYLTYNTAIERLAAATAARLAVSVSSGNATPTQEQVRACQLLQISGASTAGRTVTIPSVTRTLLIHSVAANTQNVDLVRGSTTLTIEPGEGILVFIGSGANDLTEILSYSGGGGTITIEDENSVVTAVATTINFRGSGVTVTEDTGGVATVSIPGAGTLVIEDESVVAVAAATTINFTGSGVSVTENTGGVATVTITGGGGSPPSSGSFLLDDGTAVASGVFTFDDGAAA